LYYIYFETIFCCRHVIEIVANRLVNNCQEFKRLVSIPPKNWKPSGYCKNRIVRHDINGRFHLEDETVNWHWKTFWNWRNKVCI